MSELHSQLFSCIQQARRGIGENTMGALTNNDVPLQRLGQALSTVANAESGTVLHVDWLQRIREAGLQDEVTIVCTGHTQNTHLNMNSHESGRKPLPFADGRYICVRQGKWCEYSTVGHTYDASTCKGKHPVRKVTEAYVAHDSPMDHWPDTGEQVVFKPPKGVSTHFVCCPTTHITSSEKPKARVKLFMHSADPRIYILLPAENAQLGSPQLLQAYQQHSCKPVPPDSCKKGSSTSLQLQSVWALPTVAQHSEHMPTAAATANWTFANNDISGQAYQNWLPVHSQAENEALLAMPVQPPFLGATSSALLDTSAGLGAAMHSQEQALAGSLVAHLPLPAAYIGQGVHGNTLPAPARCTQPASFSSQPCHPHQANATPSPGEQSVSAICQHEQDVNLDGGVSCNGGCGYVGIHADQFDCQQLSLLHPHMFDSDDLEAGFLDYVLDDDQDVAADDLQPQAMAERALCSGDQQEQTYTGMRHGCAGISKSLQIFPVELQTVRRAQHNHTSQASDLATYSSICIDIDKVVPTLTAEQTQNRLAVLKEKKLLAIASFESPRLEAYQIALRDFSKTIEDISVADLLCMQHNETGFNLLQMLVAPVGCEFDLSKDEPFERQEYSLQSEVVYVDLLQVLVDRLGEENFTWLLGTRDHASEGNVMNVAARYGYRLQVLKFLLEKADVGALLKHTKSGYTPLQSACRSGHKEAGIMIVHACERGMNGNHADVQTVVFDPAWNLFFDMEGGRTCLQSVAEATGYHVNVLHDKHDAKHRLTELLDKLHM